MGYIALFETLKYVLQWHMGKEQTLLGMRLRNARKKKGISLQEIGDKIGVSKSFLSQVENGKTSPSLSTLKEITGYLNVSIGSLLEPEEEEDDPLVRKAGRKRVSYSQGIIMETLTYPLAYKQMQPLYFTLEPGASSGEKKYRHFGQEFVYILRGSMQISLADTSYVLEEGDCLYFDSSTPHSFFNPSSKKTAEALWVDAPPTF